MKKSWQFFKINFQNFLEYRGDLVISFIIKMSIVIAFAFIWLRIQEDGGDIAGYGLSGIIVYYLLTQMFDGLFSSQVARALRDDVLRGTLSNKLVKPVNPLTLFFSNHLAKVLAETVMYVALAIPLFALRPDFLNSLDLRFQNILFLVVIFILACFIGFNLFMLAGLLAFWTKECSGMQSIIKNASKFFTGALIPLDLLPDYFSRIVMLTPFPYILYYPAKITMGDIGSQEFMNSCLISMLWIFILTFLNNLFWKKGLKKYESVGI